MNLGASVAEPLMATRRSLAMVLKFVAVTGTATLRITGCGAVPGVTTSEVTR